MNKLCQLYIVQKYGLISCNVHIKKILTKKTLFRNSRGHFVSFTIDKIFSKTIFSTYLLKETYQIKGEYSSFK